MVWVVTGQHDMLPTLLSGGHYTSTMIGVVSAVWSLSLAALLVLWFRRPHSVIDVWLMVVLCAWLFDIALSAILNVARFDLGFYAGRFYGLCAASFVLAVLLFDNVALQAKMSALLKGLRRQAAFDRDHYTERESLFSAVVESSNDAIITKSLDGTITGWNRAAERLFGFTAAEAVGNRIDIIVPPDKHDEARDILRRSAKGEAIEQLRNPAAAQGRPRGGCFAEHLSDQVDGGSDRRRLQDRARHRREQAGAGRAPSGNRGATAHFRDLAGPHLRFGRRGNVWFRSARVPWPSWAIGRRK